VYFIGSHGSIPSMVMPASVRHFLFCRRHLLVLDPWAQSFSTSVKIGNVFRPSDSLLTSHIRGASIITLNCTTHAYLASGQLISLLFQNSTEQLFENPLVSRPTCPNPFLYVCARWLTHYSPRVPNKARKKEICRRNKNLWVS
jgi:hypothetical protein